MKDTDLYGFSLKKYGFPPRNCGVSATLCNKEPKSELYFTWRDALTRSIVLHGRRNLTFFGNLAEKASCVDDKTVLFRYT